MKHLMRFGLTSMSLLLFAGSFAQTADEVISKHLEAIGGKDKIKSVTSVKLDNTMTVWAKMLHPPQRLLSEKV